METEHTAKQKKILPEEGKLQKSAGKNAVKSGSDCVSATAHTESRQKEEKVTKPSSLANSRRIVSLWRSDWYCRARSEAWSTRITRSSSTRHALCADSPLETNWVKPAQSQ